MRLMKRTHTLACSTALFLLAALGATTGCGGDVSGGSGGTGGSGAGTTTSTTTATTTYDSCDGPGQCVITHGGCCAGCGMPEAETVVAVNAAQIEGYRESVCPEGGACPACATQLNPNLFAYCDAGHCRAADVRTHAVSACATSADCTLRFGTDCCEPCGGSNEMLTAVSGAGGLSSLVCGAFMPCPPCVPQYPTDATVICDLGHCQVALAGTP